MLQAGGGQVVTAGGQHRPYQVSIVDRILLCGSRPCAVVFGVRVPFSDLSKNKELHCAYIKWKRKTSITHKRQSLAGYEPVAPVAAKDIDARSASFDA